MYCTLCKCTIKEKSWDKHIYSKRHQKNIDIAVKKENGEEKHGFIMTAKGITRF